MDWNLLKSFLAVGRSGSLSAASKKTGISQPTLGRHIDELEHSTGLTLFVRGRAGMSMTEQALELFEEAEQVEHHVDRLSLKAEGKSETVSGTVRVTASDIVSTYILPTIIAELGRAEPEIEIDLVVTNEIQNLLSRDSDVAIRMVKPTQLDVIAKHVNQMHMGSYAHESYLAEYGTPDQISELFQYKVIGYDRSDLILKAMRDLGIKGERGDFTFRTDDQVTYWELVKAGAGIGFGPNFIAQKTSGLVRLMPQVQLPPLDLWLASHQELRTNTKIRRVMDFLSGRFRALDLG